MGARMQSELPFRVLCRRHGAEGAYTPMLHARLFSEAATYREEHFTTCPSDRPLFVQFCANDPEVLLRAAQHVDGGACDYVDLNFGCPQRIARRGNYGAFLMDDIPRAVSLVAALHTNIKTPVSVKIRVFEDVPRTVEYARALERAGASLVAVHGRTREQKDAKAVRASWSAIAAVKAALRVPVLGNGDVRVRADADRMMAVTGVDGVLSAEPLLEDPALFAARRLAGDPFTPWQRFALAREYLDCAEEHPTHIRMIRGHMHKLLGPWFQEHTDVRDRFTRLHPLDVAACRAVVAELEAAAAAAGRDFPVPRISERKAARLAREAALGGARSEQERESAALAALDGQRAQGGAPTAAAGTACARAGGLGAAAGKGQEPCDTQQPQRPAADAGLCDGSRPVKQARVSAVR